jgi:CRISPR/Cas system-associated exonuclease Cas4 (RecB family)
MRHRTIRASEIGAYLYCRRAWWYQIRGEKPENQAEMAAGERFHRRHGRQVLSAGLMRLGAGLVILAALALLAAALTMALLR